MTIYEQLVVKSQYLADPNFLLKNEINRRNQYFFPFVFDEIFQAGVCLSNKEDYFIDAYKSNFDKYVNEFSRTDKYGITGGGKMTKTQIKILQREIDRSCFVITNNFFHIVNKIQSIGISIDLSSLNINLSNPNKYTENSPKLELSGEVVYSNISEISLGPIELELEIGEWQTLSVIDYIEYFQLVHRAVSNGELHQQSFHLKGDKFFHHALMITYSEVESDLVYSPMSQALIRALMLDESIRVVFEQANKHFYYLGQNQQFNIKNILNNKFFTDRFTIYNHNVSLNNKSITYKLEQHPIGETFDYSKSPNLDLTNNIYNLN